MRILLVEDDLSASEALKDYIERRMGHQVVCCGDGSEGLGLFEREPFPMVLSDIRMPRMDGLTLLKQIKALPAGRRTDMVLLTGHGAMDSAIEALRSGAYDYLNKPVNMKELRAVIGRIEEHQCLLSENDELTHHFEDKLAEATRESHSQLDLLRKAYSQVVGIGRLCIHSRAMREVVATAGKFHQDRSVPVLIEGRTGVGKEIVARLVHYGGGGEVTSAFVPLNCSSIAPSLFESELFGYAGGAFSGARREGRMGKFELAQGGTIFLDEIGDLPLEMQPKLLRVIQERDFFRVGGLKKISLDVRIICATNRNLAQLVQSGEFREDLYFRLSIGKITIPPLKERKEDIAPLAAMFLEQYASQKKSRFRSFSEEAVASLESYDWPGNVRELQSTVERAVLLFEGEEILPEHLHFSSLSAPAVPLEPASTSGGCPDAVTIDLSGPGLDLQEVEAAVINAVLDKFEGNKSKAAAFLGIARNSLRNKMRKGS
ncbi:sigma-54 dependent transcriptional regulator [bacterium]|nr:sigma-54 dependent transcriptional regulator [bacterium]